MVFTIKEMSEDERIRQQCQARDDYERRLIGQYNQGMAEGISQGIRIPSRTSALNFRDSS